MANTYKAYHCPEYSLPSRLPLSRYRTPRVWPSNHAKATIKVGHVEDHCCRLTPTRRFSADLRWGRPPSEEGEQGLGGIPMVTGVPAGEATVAPVTMMSYPKSDESRRNPNKTRGGRQQNGVCWRLHWHLNQLHYCGNTTSFTITEHGWTSSVRCERTRMPGTGPGREANNRAQQVSAAD